MSTEAPSQTTAIYHLDIFFKCPVGGFASLNPGICPKCYEQLMPVTASSLKEKHHMPQIGSTLAPPAQTSVNS